MAVATPSAPSLLVFRPAVGCRLAVCGAERCVCLVMCVCEATIGEHLTSVVKCTTSATLSHPPAGTALQFMSWRQGICPHTPASVQQGRSCVASTQTFGIDRPSQENHNAFGHRMSCRGRRPSAHRASGRYSWRSPRCWAPVLGSLRCAGRVRSCARRGSTQHSTEPVPPGAQAYMTELKIGRPHAS